MLVLSFSFVNVFRKQIKPLVLWITRNPLVLFSGAGKDICPQKLFGFTRAASACFCVKALCLFKNSAELYDLI